MSAALSIPFLQGCVDGSTQAIATPTWAEMLDSHLARIPFRWLLGGLWVYSIGHSNQGLSHILHSQGLAGWNPLTSL